MSEIPSGYSKLAVIGIAYKGDYDSSVTYKKLNAVYYEGSTYVALIDSPVGTPSDDDTNWKYLAKGFLNDSISNLTALDTEGLLGTKGASVNTQTLVDKIAEVLNGKEDAFTKKTAFNQNFDDSASTYQMDGTASAGTSSNVSRADHVHPSDTTKLNTNGDAKDVTVTFTSADTSTDPSYTAIDVITSGETEASLMNKVSQMAQNQRAIKAQSDTNVTNIATKQNKCVSSASGTSINVTDSVEGDMVLSDAVVNVLEYTLASLKSCNTDGTWSDNVYTYNGITFTVNDDMSITVDGTSTAVTRLYFINPMSRLSVSPFKVEKTYSMSTGLSKMESGLSINYAFYDSSKTSLLGENCYTNKIISVPSNSVYIAYAIRLNASLTVSNVTLYPQIELGSVAHNYVPYSGYEITACGKNLLGYDLTDLKSLNTKGTWTDNVYVYSGITVTVNSDLSISYSGTPTSTFGFRLANSTLPIILSVGTYTISDSIRVYKITDSSESGVQTGGTFTVTEKRKYGFRIEFSNGTTCEETTLYPQLELGDTATAYEPYTSSSVTVNADAVFPLLGLKSYDGVTNVINSYLADMEVEYSNDEVGKALLDNTPQFSNPNLLDNPWFTVNQRGASSVTSGYCVDRWKKYGSNALTVDDNGVTLPMNNTTNEYFLQFLDIDYSLICGKTFTISIMLQNGTIYSTSCLIPSTKPTSYTRFAKLLFETNYMLDFVINASGLLQFLIAKANYATATDDLSIRAVKLELGSVSTLANDTAPNYQQELAKCMRYYQRIGGKNYLPIGDIALGSTTTSVTTFLKLLVPMRTTPTLTNGITTMKVYDMSSVKNATISAVTLDRMTNDSVAVAITVTSEIFAQYAFYVLKTYDTNYIELSADL